jgi:hypothetical protein
MHGIHHARSGLYRTRAHHLSSGGRVTSDEWKVMSRERFETAPYRSGVIGDGCHGELVEP